MEESRPTTMRSQKTARARIRVTGIVQGVGFRPFIYSLASRFGLTGHVLNDSHGVLIEVQGDPTTVESFAREIRPEAPPLSSVEEVDLDWIEEVPGERGFSISQSVSENTKRALVSPDVATCEECLAEVLDSDDRRYLYPFTNCTNCGPRLTIVKDLPYDRPLTTMSDFTMCPDCQREYDDPADRRFHAQPNACPVCGPSVSLVDTAGKPIESVSDPIAQTINMLRDGMVVAVKGIGGFHLACDARNDDAVGKIRKHKGREFKPLAVMVKNMDQAGGVCLLNPDEEEMLTDVSRPIVIAQRNPNSHLSPRVAPGQSTVGIMLPYTPLHHILLNGFDGELVMTSANLSDRPIIKEINELGDSLADVIDAILTHNRDIFVRCDDSVVRSFRGELYPIRRSRGFAPKPFDLNVETGRDILALGADMKNTFCLLRGGRAFMSHHIGDVDTIETLDVLSWTVDHYKNMFGIEPGLVAVDLHPDYITSDFGRSLGPEIREIQHHHAHIASCMADNELEGEVIGVALDGTGYGTDGSIWGCEFLLADYSDFNRVANLATVSLPGGEAAIRDPWRMAVAWLKEALGPGWTKEHPGFVERIGDERIKIIEQVIDKDLNSPTTSSMGRLFDAAASMLGVRDASTYEGQAASELEAIAHGGQQDRGYEFALDRTGGMLVANPSPMIERIVSDINRRVPVRDIALSFHYAVARMIYDTCAGIFEKHRNKRVVLSGGVFQNMTLLETVTMLFEESVFDCYHHRRVPTNDGGISLGQISIAARGG
jgi:hydrogenase maturation protein HypF